MDTSKRINVNLDEREFVRLDAIRASRQEKWQSLLSRLLSEWAAEPSPRVAALPVLPPGMRAIYVPAALPDEYASLLERAARQMVDDLAEGLDTLAMGLKKTKLGRVK